MPEVEWGFALKVFFLGFGTVFLVLAIVAVTIWGTSQVIARLERSKEG